MVSSGVAAVTVAHPAAATYRFVTLTGGAVSAARTVAARTVVTLRRPATSVRKGRTLATSGTVTAVPGAVVHVQTRRGAGPWTTARRATVRGTTVTAALRLTRTGTYQVRYGLAAGTGARWTGDDSATHRVRVR